MKAHTATHADFAPEGATRSPTYQAYQILHWGFVAAPVLAGVDKFFGFLADWPKYLCSLSQISSAAGIGL